MINCTQADSLIQRGLDGRLSPAERDMLDTHLAGCAACRMAWDEYRRLAQAAAAWTKTALAADDPGAAFTEQVMAQIASGQAIPAHRPLWLPLAWGLCTLVALCALSVWIGPHLPIFSSALLPPASLLARHALVSPAELGRTLTPAPQDVFALCRVLTPSKWPVPSWWVWIALILSVLGNAFFVGWTRRQDRAVSP